MTGRCDQQERRAAGLGQVDRDRTGVNHRARKDGHDIERDTAREAGLQWPRQLGTRRQHGRDGHTSTFMPEHEQPILARRVDCSETRFRHSDEQRIRKVHRRLVVRAKGTTDDKRHRCELRDHVGTLLCRVGWIRPTSGFGRARLWLERFLSGTQGEACERAGGRVRRCAAPVTCATDGHGTPEGAPAPVARGAGRGARQSTPSNR